jgi:hypothetical protein
LNLVDENGRTLDESRWRSLFNLSLAGIGDSYSGSLSLVEVARRGHFTLCELPWENIRFDTSSRLVSSASTAITCGI